MKRIGQALIGFAIIAPIVTWIGASCGAMSVGATYTLPASEVFSRLLVSSIIALIGIALYKRGKRAEQESGQVPQEPASPPAQARTIQAAQEPTILAAQDAAPADSSGENHEAAPSASISPCAIVGYELVQGGLAVLSFLHNDTSFDVDWDPFDTVAISAAVLYQTVCARHPGSFGDLASISASAFDSLASVYKIPRDSSDYLKISFGFFGCFDQAFRAVMAVPRPYSARNSPLRTAAQLLLSLHDMDMASEDAVSKVIVGFAAMVQDRFPAIEEKMAQCCSLRTAEIEKAPGQPFLPGQAASQRQPEEHLSSNQTEPKAACPPKAATKAKKVFSYLVPVCVVGLLIGIILFSSSRLGTNASVPDAIVSSSPTSRPSPTLTAKPVSTIAPAPTFQPAGTPAPLPASGTTRYYTQADALAPLTVSVPNDGNYYFVVLSNVLTGKRMVTLFLHSGETEKIDVPLGRYRFYYCYGKEWYGAQMLFGGSGGYCAAEDILAFTDDGTYYNGYEFTLYPTEDGNWEPTSIGRAEFPAE